MATCSLLLLRRMDVLFLVLFSNLLPCFLSAVNNITYLPGFNGALPFRLETGYVTMNEETGAELFYYFAESERNPTEDPLILWLTGGPGCSAFNGLALHMGPLQVVVDNFDGVLPTLVTNPYSWTRIASMIFLDWPFVTGFSYSRNDEDYLMDDVRTKKLIYDFLKKWLLNHPHFLSNPFYMGGESYGGKMATHVAYDIVKGNEQGQQPMINLKGYLIGNAVSGEIGDKNSQVPHAYGLGIISDELYKLIQTSCVGEDYTKPRGAICAAHLKTFHEFRSEINVFGILDPVCSDGLPPSQQEMIGFHRSLEDNSAKFSCQSSSLDTNCIGPDLLANYWANNHLVRESLRIKEGTVGRWIRCNFVYALYNYTRSIPSSVPHHLYLTTRGYRALVYNGDHDLQIPFLGALEWIKSLGFSVLDPWRSWHAGGQVAGYTMSFSNNLTFATVKGGSHLAPVKRPMESFAMFERWLSQEVL